jgi:hypothetical protein
MQYCFHSGINQNPRWPRRLRELVQHDAAETGALINALRVEPELGTPARGGLPATVAPSVSHGLWPPSDNRSCG